jgi:hypothetical protein
MTSRMKPETFTSREQVVLIVDQWRPDLSSAEIDLLDAMNRYAGSHARHLNHSLNTNEEASRIMEDA